METAHTAVRGPVAARRVATRQLNHAYTILLAAEFQGFCRDLHSEGVAAVKRAVSPGLQGVVESQFLLGRQLDRGNASPSTLGADFRRFDLTFWAELDRLDSRGPHLRRLLEEMNSWRNAIAHSDFDPARLGGRMSLPIRRVRRWRVACHRVARRLDRLLADQIHQLTGVRPWA